MTYSEYDDNSIDKATCWDCAGELLPCRDVCVWKQEAVLDSTQDMKKKKKTYKSWWLTLCTYDADISHLCTHTHMCPLSVTHKHTCMHTCKPQICLIVSWEDGAVQRRYLPPVSGGIHVLSVQSVLIGKQISSSAHKPTSTPAPPLACFCDFTVFSCCWWLLQDGAVNLPSLPYTFLRDIG